MKEFLLVRNEGIDTEKSTSISGKDETHLILNTVPEEMWMQVFHEKWSTKKPQNCDLRVEDHYIIVTCAPKDKEEALDTVQVCIALANIKYTILYEDEEKREEAEQKLREKD
ncbi:MAG TPA: hypothetical protein PLE74_05410 [Candidatus Cloacimonadota bacterium]|nr:hypothetical protein [Candidatus Cloacimonadota bacterium]